MTHGQGEKKRYPKPKNFKPVKNFPKGHRHYGKLRCQAWNPNQGRQCLALAKVSDGKDKCTKHGGRSRSGIASPSFKTGRYSKQLPVRMLEQFEEMRADPELLNLRDDIALVEARIADLLTRVDTFEAGTWWKRARKAYDDLIVQMRQGNNDAVAACLNDLNRFIGAGGQDYAVWDEIMRLEEQKRKLTDSERRRLVDMQYMVTAQQAWSVIIDLMNSVTTNVSDPVARERINADFVRRTEGLHKQFPTANAGNGRFAGDPSETA